MNRILLVEDEPHLAFNLKLNLEAEGYDVEHAANGIDALDKFATNGPFAIIILDVMLPELDGYEVAKRVREQDDRTGILMLTARASETDRVTGLEAGVDDYITKPFHLPELLLRVRRMLERADLLRLTSEPNHEIRVFKCGPFELNTESLELLTPQGTKALTALEADILKEFLLQPGRVLSREYLLQKVWGLRGNMETRTVDNFVMRLRKHLEPDPKNPTILESIRGRGYRLSERVAK